MDGPSNNIDHGQNGSAQNGSTNGTSNGIVQNVSNGNGSPVPMDITEVDEDGDCEMVDSIQENCIHIDYTSESIYM